MQNQGHDLITAISLSFALLQVHCEEIGALGKPRPIYTDVLLCQIWLAIETEFIMVSVWCNVPSHYRLSVWR